MSFLEFPPLPKSTHTRKRSASDPARLASIADAESIKQSKTSGNFLAALDHIEKAKAEADRLKDDRKGREISIRNGVASLDGVVDQQSGVPPSSVNPGAAVKPISRAVTGETAVEGVARSTHGSQSSHISTVKTGKNISNISSTELKA